MKRVDAHCHVSPHWYEPVESLLFQMDRNQVEQAVLVQYMGQFDNTYQLQSVTKRLGRFAVVGLVDSSSPHALDELERLAEGGATGLRLRPDSRSPGTDPLAIWRKAETLGMVVSCNGSLERFTAESFATLVQAVPGLPILIEHLGMPNGWVESWPQEPPPFPLHEKVFALARFSNVYCKIHGLGEFCDRLPVMTGPFPFRRDRLTLLDMAYQAFGAKRMLWGSDFPPVSGREGYHNALQLTLDYFRPKGDEALGLIFGGVAARLFGLLV